MYKFVTLTIQAATPLYLRIERNLPYVIDSRVMTTRTELQVSTIKYFLWLFKMNIGTLGALFVYVSPNCTSVTRCPRLRNAMAVLMGSPCSADAPILIELWPLGPIGKL